MGKNEGRITVEDTKEKFTLKIKAFVEEDKQKFFTVWLGAFTLCGLLIISQLFVNQDSELKLMVFVFAVFWAYFEFKMVRTWRWRRVGEEVIEMDDQFLYLGKRYNERGILKAYPLDGVDLPRKFNNKSNEFVKAINDSYWMISNEQLCFNYNNRVVLFGHRLSDQEMSKVLKALNFQLKKRKDMQPS